METFTKICTKCKLPKELKEFSPNKQTKDGRASWCKKCNSARVRLYQKKNPQKVAAKQAAYWRENKTKISKAHKARYKENKKQWFDFLGQYWYTCVQCGYDRCEAAIEYHHLDSEKKQFSACDFMNQHRCNTQNKARLSEELRNCVPLCCLCHRELHFMDKEGR